MMHHILKAGVAAVAMISIPALSNATELRMIGGFPDNFIWTTEIAKPFMALVQDKSNGEITVSLQGPDVIPTFEQLEPVQAGVYDLLFTHPAYHSGVSAVGLSIDAISPDPVERRDAGVIEFIDQHYQKLGLKLISAPATGSLGFRYFLKQPITGTPGLDGRKIRGTVSYHPMIKALGGSPVVLPGGEVYSALQNSVIDGAAWGLTGAKDYKWYEVASYLADPTFGQVGLMVFMNLDTWNSLNDEERAMFEVVGKQLEVDTIVRFNKLAAEEKEALLGLGMKMTQFAESEGKQFEALWANGVWEVAIEKTPEDAAKLRAIAQKAGLTP
ncbi:MAG: TRAP transporter substrate-binding protein DctP [Sneathiella sp.]